MNPEISVRRTVPLIFSAVLCLLPLGCGGGGGGANAGATDPFYDISSVSSGQAPGTLVRTAAYPVLSLQRSTNSRIMYISVDGNGVSVPTTAFVAIPNGTPPAGGWPIISWAHPTEGVGKNCAPSMTSDLVWALPFIQSMIDHGYAVVGTDYSGMGTTGRHFYTNRISNALDAIEAVVAATTAYPSLSKSFVVAGISEGGGSALGAAETVGTLSIAPLQYKGAVAIAPDTGLDYYDFLAGAQNGVPDAIALSYYLYIAYAIKLSNPQLSYSDMFLPDVAAAMPDAENTCVIDLWNHLSVFSYPKNAVQPAWVNNPILKAYTHKNAAGKVKATGPLFVVWGGADTTVTPAVMNYFVPASCGLGSDLHSKVYPGETHFTVLDAAQSDIFAWIAQQFAGTYISPAVCGT